MELVGMPSGRISLRVVASQISSRHETPGFACSGGGDGSLTSDLYSPPTTLQRGTRARWGKVGDEGQQQQRRYTHHI